MLRILSAPTLIAVLGFGGLALAQDGLIVDPWKHAATETVNAPPAPGVDRTRPAVGTSTYAERGSEPRHVVPSVEPLGPPLILTVDPWVVAPVAPVLVENVVDPWKGSRLASRTAAHRAPVHRRGPTVWARAIDEIIDPWAKGPLAVVTDPLIVDPWAR